MKRPSRREWLAWNTLALAGWGAAGIRPVHGRTWADREAFGPFTCVADFPLAHLRPQFEELQRLERELQRTLATPPVDANIDVYLLADETAHRSFLAARYPHVPYRRALYVRSGGQSAVYAYQHEQLSVDLRHECTHALLHANLDNVPLWLDEGLAEYFEMPEQERAFCHPHLAALRWYGRFGMFQTVESLEERQDLHEMGQLEYRFAWAWVHFMLHGPAPAHRALVGFLAELRRGESGQPLSNRLRTALPDVETRIERHFRHWSRQDWQLAYS